MTTRWSRIRTPAAFAAAKAAARTTTAVPCMSSLKVQSWSAYLLRIRRALPAPRSSQCSSALGNSLVAALTKASTKSSYRCPRTREWRLPRYASSLSRPRLSVPTSSPAGIDAGCGRVERQLADGDVDAADTPVADTEDALGVGGHDEIHLVGPQPVVAERLLDEMGVVDGEEHAVRAAVLVAVPLDGLPDCWGIDDREHLVEVLHEQPVEQDLVPFAQVGEVDMLCKVVRLPPVLRVDPAGLPVDRGHRVGQ